MRYTTMSQETDGVNKAAKGKAGFSLRTSRGGLALQTPQFQTFSTATPGP